MEGSIEFDGEILERIKPHEIVKSGLVQVTQSKESYPAMTVEENLMVGSYVRSDRNAIKQDLEKIYQFFPILKKRRKTLSGTLSGGEVQMLVIGRGLMANPKMLMLDEPTNNLDIPSAELLEQALDDYAGTVFVISHDRYFLDRVVDRVVELDDGELTEFAGGYADYREQKAAMREGA